MEREGESDPESVPTSPSGIFASRVVPPTRVNTTGSRNHVEDHSSPSHAFGTQSQEDTRNGSANLHEQTSTNDRERNASRKRRQSVVEPETGMRKKLGSIFHRQGEPWSLYKVAKIIILQLQIVRTFSDNRKTYEYMCEICKKLELHQKKFLVSDHSSDRRQQAYTNLLSEHDSQNSRVGPFGSGSNRYNLGTLRSIEERSRRCPFCKLVIHSLEHLKSKEQYDEDIKKCKDRINKLNEEATLYEDELYKIEIEFNEMCEERVRMQSEQNPRLSGSMERFSHTVKEYEKIVGQTKEAKVRCEAELGKANEDIANLEVERETHWGNIEEAVCYASFQMDGREVERDESGEVVTSRPRTRRIRLRWSQETLETSYIVLVAPEPGREYDSDQRHVWESDTLFLARSMGSANKNQALVKSWVDLCHDHHGKLCNVEPGEEFKELISKAFFGVIDVAEMRLTALPPNSRYVALSYTWGEQPLYTTNLSNIQLHQEFGGLQKKFSQLPKVIRDAIELVRSLGERYLWVDSICIVQKNNISWNLNSSVMDLVYGYAYVTICAAEGEGAQMGLKGLDNKRQVSQKIEECAKGLRLTVSHLAETYIEKSRWNTRGWTFQERLLSRRCIIFAGNRVFFQCRSTALSEDVVGEQDSAGWSIELVRAPLQMLLDIETKAFAVYTECIRLYSKRNLGARKDVLAAFRGMANMIGKEMGAPLHFGLPTSHFDLALLWSPMSSCQRRTPQSDEERVQFGDSKFPSWSWCGWSNSSIEYRKEVIGGCLANVNQWLREHTWIRWYIRDGEGDLRPIWTDSSAHGRTDSAKVDSRWLGYQYNSEQHRDDYGRTVSKDYTQHGSRKLENSHFTRTLLEYPFGICEADPWLQAKRSYPDQPYLQFWTWAARLRVSRRDDSLSDNIPEPGPGLVRCDIEDYCGDWCGTIVLNRHWFDSWYKNHAEEKSVHEFIAISEAKDFSKEESDMWTYYVPREEEHAEWHLFYVILVTRRGGIHYREGLGKVFKEAFAKSYLPGKEWKEIIMG